MNRSGTPQGPHATAPPSVWLLLAVAAMALSTCAAAGLVLARLPGVGPLLPLARPFPTLLVLHVDFAVGVWFLAMAAVLWQNAPGRPRGRGSWLAAALAGTGMALMALTPLLAPDATPLLSDYLPVLAHPLFLAGAVLFLAGWGLLLPGALLGPAWPGVAPAPAAGTPPAQPHSGLPAQADPALRWAAAVGLVALLGLAAGWLLRPAGPWPESYPGIVWGPGHLLQTLHMLLALAAWLWLARLDGRVARTGRLLRALPALIAVPALAAGVVLPLLPVVAGERAADTGWLYTAAMAWSGSLSLLGMAACGRRPPGAAEPVTPYGTVLRWSWLLYGVGAGLGLLIQGNDTLVPAHYHGAIGGLTLAYMGLVLRLLERHGAAARAGLRPAWITWQARTYGLGLLAMIAGLVLAALPRKTAVLEGLATGWIDQAGVLLMGIGGAAALAGSVGFLLLAAGALRHAWGPWGSPVPVPGEQLT